MKQSTRIKPTLTINSDAPREEIIEGKRAKVSEGRLELMFDFGMPDDEDEMVIIKLAGDRYGEEFRNYTVELFGVAAEDLEPDPREWLQAIGSTTPHHVVYTKEYRRPGHFWIDQRAAMYVWLRRVCWQGKEILIEEIWNPRTGWVPTINKITRIPISRIPLEADCRTLEGQKLTKALLHAIETDGLPVDWIRIKAIEKAQQLAREGTRFSIERIGEAFNVTSRSTIYKYLYAVGKDFDKLLRQECCDARKIKRKNSKAK